MIIKNYIVNASEKFMDCLEQELCKNGISYVRIDNKIHFLDRILRFYDPEVDKEAILIFALSQISIQEIKAVEFTRSKQDFIEFVPKSEVIEWKGLAKPYQARNKFIQKQESYKVKQQLKMYQR